ncbi:MAG: zf-HC2 domain-containing protein [Planctomycetes bacterium]|nr:zf-HC2 domain-containing protein [Planctomycetota bacterium]
MLRAFLGGLSTGTHHPAGAGEACPDAGLLARFVDGAVADEERAALEAHLAECSPCRRLVVSVTATDDHPVGPPGWVDDTEAAIRPVSRSKWLLLAASLLLALGLGALWLRVGFGSSDHTAPVSTDEALGVLAAELRAEHPELFGEFRPLTHDERLATPPASRHDGVRLLAPAGVVLDPRPVFRWDGVIDIATWQLRLFGADARELWSVETTAPRVEPSADRTPLATGATYLWELSGVGRLGTVRGTGAFRVATLEQQQRFERAVAAIEAAADEPLDRLLIAHLALRWEHYGVAEQVLRDALAGGRPDLAFLETLYLLLGRLGAAEREVVRGQIEGR